MNLNDTTASRLAKAWADMARANVSRLPLVSPQYRERMAVASALDSFAEAITLQDAAPDALDPSEFDGEPTINDFDNGPVTDFDLAPLTAPLGAEELAQLIAFV